MKASDTRIGPRGRKAMIQGYPEIKTTGENQIFSGSILIAGWFFVT